MNWEDPQDDRLTERQKQYLEEMFCLNMGMLPTVTVNEILKLAYSQPGVIQANVEVDWDLPNDGQSPKLTVLMHIKPSLRFKLATYGKKRGGILGKLLYIAMAMLGAPVAIEPTVKSLVGMYLPSGKWQSDAIVTAEPLVNTSLPKEMVKLEE